MFQIFLMEEIPMKSKEDKQKEAKQRSQRWMGLTFDQKVEELKQRPGACRKQLNKLVRSQLPIEI
jgi:hypothetical protein